MSLLDAPIWNDPATWIVLGVSLLFIVVGIVMHRIIMKVVRRPAPPTQGHKGPVPPHE
ncbi:hypothetical protein [Diaphorobacter sp.]|uniref:hypothetical protein n=1 Tax=Diaphorobacter sp. TaxID=1934310 RepID=UPI00258AE15B|nr:hypothetical protein [Diaphorobacter sp.]